MKSTAYSAVLELVRRRTQATSTSIAPVLNTINITFKSQKNFFDTRLFIQESAADTIIRTKIRELG
jgi:hypothetical protein